MSNSNIYCEQLFQKYSFRIMSKLILASGSLTRKKILATLGVSFQSITPEIDETPRNGESPIELVERLSISKAKAVSRSYPQHLIIGSDQVAVLDGKIIGKPKNREHAIEQLQTASGKSVTMYSGLALLNSLTGSLQADVLPYRVMMRKLTREWIERYIDLDQPYDCCGSLRSEGLGIVLLREFEGTDPNILLGLPLIRLIDMLQEENFHVL